MSGPVFTERHEEWRPVVGFPAYAVSSLGRVKRIVEGHSSAAGRLLKLNTIHGYKYVNLSQGGQVKACRVNRLVCTAFHGAPPTSAHHAAHNNGIRDDNEASNLRWATSSQNNMDKRGHGTMAIGDRNGARTKPENLARGSRNGKHTKPERTPRGEFHGHARLTTQAVVDIRKDPRSQRVIAAAYGVSRGAIVGIKTGKTWRHVQ